MKCPNGYLEQLMTPLEICDWKLGSKVDQGEDGYILQACCKDKCKFIVKVIENRNQRSTFLSKVANEISIQNEFAGLGLAPKILDAWMCNNEASIVMEKKDMNLVKYVSTLVQSGVIPETSILSTIDSLQSTLLQLVDKAHQNNLVHKDLHLKNVMVDVDDDLDWYNMKIIDFGKSGKVKSVLEANREEPIGEIKLSFDMLKRSVTTPVAVKSPPKAPKKKQPQRSPQRSPKQSNRSLFDSPSPARVKKSLFDDDEDDIFRPKGLTLSFD